MVKRAHIRLSREKMYEISDKLIKLTVSEMEETGEGRGKVMLILPPPSTDALIIYSADMGYQNPREVMPFAKSMIAAAEDENGVGVIAALASVAEAWMVSIDKTVATWVDPATIPPPSEHPDKIEVVICTVSTPYGDGIVRIYDTVRDSGGNFVRLDLKKLGGDGTSLEEDQAVESVFNPWHNFDGASWAEI